MCVIVCVPLSSNKLIHFKSQTVCDSESVLVFNLPRNHTNKIQINTDSPESLQGNKTEIQIINSVT